TPKRPPRPEESNQFGSGGATEGTSAFLSGRVGAGWVLRPEPAVPPDEVLPPETPLSSPGFPPSAVSLVTTAPAGEGAGAVVVVATLGGVVALPPPGPGSPTRARTRPAETQTTATHAVARAIARRTRLSITRVSWVRGNGNAVDHIGAGGCSSPF